MFLSLSSSNLGFLFSFFFSFKKLNTFCVSLDAQTQKLWLIVNDVDLTRTLCRCYSDGASGRTASPVLFQEPVQKVWQLIKKTTFFTFINWFKNCRSLQEAVIFFFVIRFVGCHKDFAKRVRWDGEACVIEQHSTKLALIIITIHTNNGNRRWVIQLLLDYFLAFRKTCSDWTRPCCRRSGYLQPWNQRFAFLFTSFFLSFCILW